MIVFAGCYCLRVLRVAVGFAEPVAVFDIVASVGLIQGLSLFGVNLLDELGRHSAPKLTVAYLRIAQDESSRSHDCALANDGVIEHGCTHSDQCTVLHYASMQGDAMPDGNVVAKNTRRFAVESMDARVVLNVCAIAYLDEMYVASHDSIEPDGAVVAHLYVAHYHSTLAEVAVLAKSGSRHPLECLDYCHLIIYYLTIYYLRFIYYLTILPSFGGVGGGCFSLPHSGVETAFHTLSCDTR